jgi:hypothetical protein
VLEKIRPSRPGIRSKIAKLDDDLLHVGAGGAKPVRHEGCGKEHRHKQRELRQPLLGSEALLEIGTQCTEDLGRRTPHRVGLIPEHGLDS